MAGSSRAEGPDLMADGVPVSDVSPGAPVVGHVAGKPVLIVRTAEGVRAVGARCSHYGGPLADGICTDGTIHCPWHHAAFDLSTGNVVGPPALDPIPVYDVSEVEGRVYVTGPVERPLLHPSTGSAPRSVVIVGAGAAGAAAAESLRDHGHTGSITLIGDEIPVDRPNLSKDYLAGTAPEEWIPLRSDAFYAKAGIDFDPGRSAVAIDTAERVVSLSDGRDVAYDALLLATGAAPRRLPVPGADNGHVHYLRTLDDSRRILAGLRGVGRVAVVGAGFIGLEVAASLRHRDIPVTVIAPEEIPLAHLVGQALGRFVLDLHRQHGVDFRLGRTVASIEAETVVLDDGTSIDADLVVVGVGVSPRTGLAEEAGLEVSDGVVVDSLLSTADPHIWAAGDVARYPDPFGKPVRVEHWVHAQWQGRVAAQNILGADVAFHQPPFFWSQHYDVPINVTGHLNGWQEESVVGDPADRDVIVVYRTEGRISAVASIYRDEVSLRAEQLLASGNESALAETLGV